MNVHPAKTELRFRDPNAVRALIDRGAEGGARDRGAPRNVVSVASGARPRVASGRGRAAAARRRCHIVHRCPAGARGRSAFRTAPRRRSTRSPSRAATRAGRLRRTMRRSGRAYPLGAARAQLHDTFIIAETEDALVIVDQHAAHERLVYERLKRSFGNGGIARQLLLIPEVVELDAESAALLLGRCRGPGAAGPCGRAVRRGGACRARGAVAARHRATSKACSRTSPTRSPPRKRARRQRLLVARLDHVLSTMACHGSVRAGAQAQPGRDERAAARHGADALHRPVQSRPPDLCRAQARRHREALLPPLGLSVLAMAICVSP